VLAGSLDPRALQFVREWAVLRRGEIMANWERARRNVVVGVAVVGNRVLRLLFGDGTAGDVDFSAERWTGVLSPLNDPAYFAKVTVDQEAGTLVWPDGIDLAPEPLYEQAKAHPLLAA
jgi:hypothetical protein